MTWLVVFVIGGYVVYVMRPEERARAVARTLGIMAGARDAIRRQRRPPDAFRDALDARTRGPFLTATVVLLNLAIFALMVTGAGRLSDPHTLVRWGGSVGPLTTNGQWWRLLTATFVHAGLVQLVVDVAALSQAAVLVERMFGHAAFAGVYLTSAAFAAAIGVWAEPLAVSTGASGAIFGIHGVLIAVIVRGTLQRSPVTIPIRLLRRLAPPAAAFVLYYMAMGGAQWTSGLATFVIGFAIGLALTRNVAERTPTVARVAALATAALAITLVIAVPLSGMTDARSEISRLIAMEDQTARAYRAATEQYRLGAIKAEGLAQLIERNIVPQLQTVRSRLQAIAGVPRQQQPLVASADEYLRLRSESWLLRARALHKSNMRLLRDADEKERTSLLALDKLRPAVAEGTRVSS